MSKIIERAVTSVFAPLVEMGIEEPTAQLKALERKMRQINGKEGVSFSGLSKALQEGVSVKIGQRSFVAFVREEDWLTTATSGLVKRLSRQVNKRTKNPKESRGTVYRRNSVVVERRRPVPDWRTGQAARMETSRKNQVTLIPLIQWQAEQEQREIEEREGRLATVLEKKDKRARKKAFLQELERRSQPETIEELLAQDFLESIEPLAEKDGLANPERIVQNVAFNLACDKPQPLLFVWGPPYVRQSRQEDLFEISQPEGQMALEIESFLEKVSKVGVPLLPILLYADTYGTEVNRMEPEEVDFYGQRLKNRFGQTASFIPWSGLRKANLDRYQTLRTVQALPILATEIASAQKTQERLGQEITLKQASSLARAYRAERLIEGQILAEGFSWQGQRVEGIIKLGTAPSRKRNDDPYEPDVPRIYLKNMSRAAWYKKRKIR